MIIIKFNVSIDTYRPIIKKIDISTIKKLSLKNNNPIINYKNHQVTLKSNYYILDNYYSKFHQYTYENGFFYGKKIFELIENELILSDKLNLLCLGFGLGGIPLKASTLDNITRIDSVDLDYSLFEIYNTVIDNKPSKINLYWNDAIDYLKYSENTYDIIIDDLFNHLIKIEYNYKLVGPRLNKNGYFILNWFKSNNVPRIIKILEKNFSTVKYYDTGGNVVIVCQYFIL